LSKDPITESLEAILEALKRNFEIIKDNRERITALEIEKEK